MKLDEQQKQAVRSTAKNVIVAAGAGSGKTRVIVERICWLLTTGARPNSIVAITFTNMAAQEMKARLRDIPRTGDMFIGTIHSFANRILRNSGKPYEIYNEEKQNRYMQYLCGKYGKHLTKDRYLEYAETKKNVDLGLVSEDVLHDSFTVGERFELEMFLSHRNPKRNDEYPATVWTLAKVHNVITFDQLLKLSADYFQSTGIGGIAHLLVDELQDIGHLEYKFLTALGADNNFFVGDDWQAIYGFKGGNVKIFKSLISNKEWERVDLVNNYRSGLEIIRTATDVIGQCDDIVFKEVVAKTETQGEVITDSKFRFEAYLEEIFESQRLGDWFILVRKNEDLEKVRQRLEEMELPYDTFKKADLTFAELQDIVEANTVKLLTIHMAKGLEAENVLLWGDFPLDPPPYFVNKEERRVLYVGITRAKNKCIILQ